jgi:hypothetical protein
MDGMFRANIPELTGIEGEENYLLEVKFPHRRELKKYKTSRVKPKGTCIIPGGYVAQIKMGLCVIDLCNVGLFMDCLARICTMPQMTTVEGIGEMSPLLKNEVTTVLASGAIKLLGDKYKGIDFGNDYHIMKEIKDGEIETELVFNMGLEIPEVEDCGFICWKLFDVYYGVVEQDDKFLDQYYDRMIKVSELCHKCKNMTTEQKINELDGLKI